MRSSLTEIFPCCPVSPCCAEQICKFPGGQTEMMQFISKNMKYPTIAQENGTQGRVTCQFVVGADGRVRDVNVL